MIALQLPNGVSVSPQTFAERKARVDDVVRQAVATMKRLRLLYEKVNESTTRMDSRPIEV